MLAKMSNPIGVFCMLKKKKSERICVCSGGMQSIF